jgi:hypothetical protein
MNRYSIKMYWRMKAENIYARIARLIPLRLLYFAVIRAIAIATSGPKYGNREVPAVLAMDVAKHLSDLIDPPPSTLRTQCNGGPA